MNEESVLCGANAALEKYYFNPRYGRLPDSVKEELRTALVLFAARVGGTILIAFSESGEPQIRLMHGDDEIYYDEIEAELQVSRLQKEKEALFRQLQLFYLGFFGEHKA